MQTPHTNFSPEEAAAFKKVVAAIAGLEPDQVLKIFEHVQGQLADEGDDMPMFARGIAGPLGKLDFPLKTKVDEQTHTLFLQQCNMRRTDTSSVLRDAVYAMTYGKTHTQMVIEKASHDDQCAQAMTRLIGPMWGPESKGGGR